MKFMNIAFVCLISYKIKFLSLLFPFATKRHFIKFIKYLKSASKYSIEISINFRLSAHHKFDHEMLSEKMIEVLIYSSQWPSSPMLIKMRKKFGTSLFQSFLYNILVAFSAPYSIIEAYAHAQCFKYVSIFKGAQKVCNTRT